MAIHLFASVAVVVSCCANTSVAAQDSLFHSRNTSGYYRQPGRAYGDIMMPAPIRRAELLRWASTMELSDVQLERLSELHVAYAARENKIHDELVQPLWDHSAELSEFGSLSQSVQRAEQWVAMLDRPRRTAVNRLIANENQLFSELTPHLLERQLPLLEQSRAKRRRDRTDRQSSTYPGGAIDLTDLMHELRLQDDLEADQQESFVLVVSEYDTVVTPLFERRASAGVDAAGRGSLLTASRFAIGLVPEGSEAWKEAQSLKHEHRRLRRRLTDLEKRIHDVNSRFVGRFAEHLAPDGGKALRQRLNEQVYHPVYPDPTDATSLLEASVNLPSLTAEQREQLADLLTLYTPTQIMLCDKLEVRFLQWREFIAIENKLPPGGVEAYDDDMFALHDARVRHASQTLEILLAILETEQTEELADDIAAFFARFDEHKFNPDWQIGGDRDR